MNGTDYFADKDIMQDLLSSEKHISDACNVYACDATCQDLRHLLENILADIHKMYWDIWDSMTKRGWCKIKNANSQEIEMCRQKFEQAARELK